MMTYKKTWDLRYKPLLRNHEKYTQVCSGLHFSFQCFNHGWKVTIANPWLFATLYSSFAAAAIGVGWETDSANPRASLMSWIHWLHFWDDSVDLNSVCNLEYLQTFCWCFKGKAVGYRDLTIDGPYSEYIGALMAPSDTTCNFTYVRRFLRGFNRCLQKQQNKIK
jgi:hypothetical protein